MGVALAVAMIASLVSAGSAPAAAAADPIVLTVSPTGAGTDCTAPAPCSPSTAIDQLPATAARGQAVVEFLSGRYPLRETLVLGADSSGTGDAPTILRAAEGAAPILSGGVEVGQWEPVDGAANLWRGRAADGGPIRQLFADDVRLTPAKSDRCNPGDCVVTREGLTGPGAARLLALPDVADVEAVIAIRWRNYHCAVARTTADALIMKQPCWANSSSGTGRVGPAWDTKAINSPDYLGVREFVGSASFISEPGEFAYDSAAKTVTYQAADGEDPNARTFYTPRLETLLRIAGTASDPVHDVRVERLGFQHSAWLQPGTAEGYAGMQAGLTLTGETGPRDAAGRYYTKPASAILVRSGRSVLLDAVRVLHTGGAGVVLEAGTQSSGVTHSHFEDLSSGAIYTGDMEPNPPAELESRSNTYEHNVVRSPGREYTDAVGIWGGYEAETSISHNTLEQLPYSGISLGWGWNQTVARSPYMKDNRIDANRIIDAVMPWSEQHDAGAIYTQGPQPGSTINENYIHKHYDANAIYLDEQSSHFTVNRNVITGSPGSTWLSNWAAYGINNSASGNWSTGKPRKMNGNGSTQTDQHESLTYLPAAATAVAAAAGANPPGEVFAPAPLQITVARTQPLVAGVPARIDVAVTNADGENTLDSLQVSVEWPDGWSVVAASPGTFTGVAPGATSTAAFDVTPVGGFSAGVPVTVTATADDAESDDTVTTTVPLIVVAGANLALGRPATQSSTFVFQSGARLEPAAAVDGSTAGTSYQHTAQGDDRPWWQVDLGSVSRIGGLILWNRTDCCQSRASGIWVFVSDDPITQDDPALVGADEAVRSYFLAETVGRPSALPIDARGRYVRLQLDTAATMLSLAEVQVFGQADPVPQPVEVTASPRCLAGKAYLYASAVNVSDRPLDLTLSSAFGTKTLRDLAPGKTAAAGFPVRSTSIDAGALTATIPGSDPVTVAYPALSCAG
ncbi:discoidin domain-containing protein [Microbacterium sp. BWT-B31]|uniref:galactose-binding domain-containing protein n=1 Tax=Microbacterium sp. BWT-B31 TaxID=3232072 RepID=UPI0035285E5A